MKNKRENDMSASINTMQGEGTSDTTRERASSCEGGPSREGGRSCGGWGRVALRVARSRSGHAISDGNRATWTEWVVVYKVRGVRSNNVRPTLNRCLRRRPSHYQSGPARFSSSASGSRFQSGPPGSRRQSGPPGSRRQSGPPGSRRQSGPEGSLRQSGPEGSRRQSSPEGSRRQSGPEGSRRQSGPEGPRRQSGPPGSLRQSGPEGSRRQSGPERYGFDETKAHSYTRYITHGIDVGPCYVRRVSASSDSLRKIRRRG